MQKQMNTLISAGTVKNGSKRKRRNEAPSCRLRCTVCQCPDCEYDGDYVSLTEERAAAKQDKRALWYRLTWAEIEHREKHKESARKRYEGTRVNQRA